MRSAILTLGLMLFGLFTFQVSASTDITINGDVNLYTTANEVTTIDDISLTGTTPDPVPVKLLVSNGTLSFGSTAGLTFTGPSSGSELFFTGSISDVNNALATLRYSRATTGSDTLEVSLVNPGEVFFPNNGHLYEYVSDSGDWNSALTKASARTKYDSTGYLATITSAEENAFVTDRLSGAGWMGASDSASEGSWRWVTGPESGTLFWSGDSNGSAVGGAYENWNGGEPNNSGDEDCAQYLSGGTGLWNDLPCSGTSLSGYVVEYGADGDEPNVVGQNFSVTTVAVPSVSTTTPTDNAVGVSVSNNLLVEFNDEVQLESGDVVIYRSSDDTVIEAINVASGQLTISNDNTLVINPSENLPESTEIYIQIDGGVVENTANSDFPGINDDATWSFTTGDFTAPIISNITTVRNKRSLIINFTTDEGARTQLDYGLTNGLGNTNDLNINYLTDHSVEITGLEPQTNYYIQITAIDSSTNNRQSSVFTVETWPLTGGSTAPRVTNTTASNLNDSSSDSVEVNVDDSFVPRTEIVETLLSLIVSRQANATITQPIRDLYYGTTGSDVVALQNILIDQGYEIPAGPTGLFVEQTETALSNYQQDNNIIPSAGYFGSITRNHMKSYGISGLWW